MLLSNDRDRPMSDLISQRFVCGRACQKDAVGRRQPVDAGCCEGPEVAACRRPLAPPPNPMQAGPGEVR